MKRAKSVLIATLSYILPDRLKRSLFHLSFHLAAAEFERFAHEYNFAPNMKLGLAELQGRRFLPETIIDVGAFKGDWSKLAKGIWPASRLFMIEPNLTRLSELAAVAKDLEARAFAELLGANDGQVVQFNVMGSGSSVLPERSSVPRHVETRHLRRLDTLLKEITGPALLKIDAQGYELEILKGSTGLMRAIEAILLEISIIAINEGVPLIHDVLNFMRDLGFVTYDILEIHRRPLDGALNQIDLIFVREQSPLIADKRHFA
jgi:FkbM family methyltransferase